MTIDTNIAAEFINTDLAAVKADIERLGLEEAAVYNVELAQDDERFESVTVEAMTEAMRAL